MVSTVLPTTAAKSDSRAIGIATRFHIFLDDGPLGRVPQRIGYELPFGRDAIPEFAGTRHRVAAVLVESENGKPLRILNRRGLYWIFNAEGRIDCDIRQQWAEHVDTLSPRANSKKCLSSTWSRRSSGGSAWPVTSGR